MYTPMEKDELIEACSGMAAYISQRMTPEDIKLDTDIDRCVEIREIISSMMAEDIDFDSVMRDLKEIRSRWIDRPCL